MGLLTPNIYSHEANPKVHVLDVAGGTGDIAFKIIEKNDPKSKQMSN